MTIDSPKNSHAMALRSLFADSFGEGEAFLDDFFNLAYSPSRARVLTESDEVLSALYWFDCELCGKKLAYIFAVSTARAERGRGLCSALMNDTHAHLRSLDYAGALLVPAEQSLFGFYERLGYKAATGIAEISATASKSAADLRELSPEEYLSLREKFLPTGGVKEGIEVIKLLAKGAKLYTGGDFILAARKSGNELLGIELLGNTEKFSDILASLKCTSGAFRTVGEDRSFSMMLPFTEDLPTPTYLGIALDI